MADQLKTGPEVVQTTITPLPWFTKVLPDGSVLTPRDAQMLSGGMLAASTVAQTVSADGPPQSVGSAILINTLLRKQLPTDVDLTTRTPVIEAVVSSLCAGARQCLVALQQNTVVAASESDLRQILSQGPRIAGG